jgi:plastocyanin
VPDLIRQRLTEDPRAHRRLAVVIVAILTLSSTLALSGVSQAANASVTIANLSFSPATVNINPGERVTFTNRETDGTLHQISGGPFNSPDLRPGQSYSQTLATPGTYEYFCRLHTYMTGKVVVGGGTGPTTTLPPTTTATTAPPGTTTTLAPTTSTTHTMPGSTTTTAPGGTTTTAPTTPPTTIPPGGVGADLGDGTRLAEYTVEGGVKVFRLTMDVVQWETEPGVVQEAYAFNGIVPGPVIRLTEGDRARFIVTNNLPEETAVHWHGMVLPNSQDGVPHMTQDAIPPGGSFTYEWTAITLGTHWYHSHMGGGQVGRGLFGSLEIEPRSGPAFDADRDYRLLIGDGMLGLTLNGRSFPATVPLQANVGETVRIRLIGTGPEQIHPIHLHGMAFTVVAQDGHTLSSPYTVDTLSVAPGQTFDILARPTRPGPWMLHCHIFSHSEDADGMTGLVTTLQVT